MPKKICAALLALSLTACAKTTGTGATDVLAFEKKAVCTAFLPITWSKRDTDQTILEVKQHNATNRIWCQ